MTFTKPATKTSKRWTETQVITARELIIEVLFKLELSFFAVLTNFRLDLTIHLSNTN